MDHFGCILAAKTVEGTRLHFSGDFTWWMAVILAGGAALAAAWIYRGDIKGRMASGLWMLPLLRVGAIVLVVMMLSGPVIQSHTSEGTTARVLLYVDASASMKATDKQMELPRKLRIIRQFGWIEGDAPEEYAASALDRLRKLSLLLTKLESGTKRDVPENIRHCQAIVVQAMDDLKQLKLTSWTPDKMKLFREEIATPLQKLDPDQMTASEQALIISLRPVLASWEKTLSQFMPTDEGTMSKLDDTTKAALERFDRTPRWQRLESQLLGEADSLVDQLTSEHNVELLALTGRRFQMLWHPGAISDAGEDGESDTEYLPPPKTLEAAATNMISDLATGIEKGVVSDTSKENLHVVLFTDGQHNVNGASPLEMARQFKDRGVAIHAVGLGTVLPARDLAVLKTEAPSSVYPDARLTGQVILHDGMPSGKPFKVHIEHKGQVVWQQDFVTAQKMRKLPFDFPIKDIVSTEQAAQSRDIRYANLPLAFNIVVPPIEGEMKDDNNAGILRINVVTQKPRILVIDGRPRWEFRYLRNLLERDNRWETNTVLCDWTGGQPILGPRGNDTGRFPARRELLFQYQLIVLGDVSPRIFTQTEMQWIRDYVQFNGGGLICIDGRMERLVNFAGSPLFDLFPVRFWGDRALSSMKMRVRFRSAGGAQAPLMLAANTADNVTIWNDLPGPRWAAVTEALPGAETLLEIVNGNSVVPGLVFRRWGAGRVLYSAFDETWRWRFNIGDRYHQRYWNQVAKWIMEPPFAVQDSYIAMDSGPTTYDVEDTAEIRVRIMNPELARKFQLQPKLKPEAILLRDGRVFGTFPLEADPESFTYRARSAPLEPGDYEVRVRLPEVPEEAIKVSTAFTVATNPFGELGRLHCDEHLLKQVASDSGGDYYREEEMHRLIEALGPASDRREIVEEIVLWQSYWWFVPVMLLLTTEWILRRVKGMV
ncbi:MAG: VWA domain-containing protein [Verrucomicrobiota bacterium]|nr:VWA domain-containing protein [Verrucomicrobiota bacterium]